MPDLNVTTKRLRRWIEKLRDGIPLLYEGDADLCELLEALADAPIIEVEWKKPGQRQGFYSTTELPTGRYKIVSVGPLPEEPASPPDACPFCKGKGWTWKSSGAGTFDPGGYSYTDTCKDCGGSGKKTEEDNRT